MITSERTIDPTMKPLLPKKAEVKIPTPVEKKTEITGISTKNSIPVVTEQSPEIAELARPEKKGITRINRFNSSIDDILSERFSLTKDLPSADWLYASDEKNTAIYEVIMAVSTLYS